VGPLLLSVQSVCLHYRVEIRDPVGKLLWLNEGAASPREAILQGLAWWDASPLRACPDLQIFCPHPLDGYSR